MSMRQEKSLKGVSPLVATVLLIAFVVSIAGILASWANLFAQNQTELVSEQSETSITCSYGAVDLRNGRFASDSSTLSAIIVNNGQIPVGGMSLGILYQNATSETIGLCGGSGGGVSCATGNLSIPIGGQTTFNVTIGGDNYDSVKLITNCTSTSDTLDRAFITSS